MILSMFDGTLPRFYTDELYCTRFAVCLNPTPEFPCRCEAIAANLSVIAKVRTRDGVWDWCDIDKKDKEYIGSFLEETGRIGVWMFMDHSPPIEAVEG